MMTLAADVNPDTTGIDMNSTKNPKRKMPSNIVVHPDRKQSKAAYSGIPLKKKSSNLECKCTFILYSLDANDIFSRDNVNVAYEKCF